MLKARGIKGYSKMRKSQLVNKVIELKIDFTQIKSSKNRRVMTEERKQILRERLKKAREVKQSNRQSNKVVIEPKKVETSTSETIQVSTIQETEDNNRNQMDKENNLLKEMNKEIKIKILKRTREEKKKREEVKFDDIMTQIKLPDKVVAGVNMNDLLVEVLKLLNDELVKKIFSSKLNAKTTKRLIKKNKKLSPNEIVRLLDEEFDKKEEKKEDVEVDDNKLSLIDSFINTLENFD